MNEGCVLLCFPSDRNIQEGTNVHFSDVHVVLCQIFGLNHLMLPFHAFFSRPSSLLVQH